MVGLLIICFIQGTAGAAGGPFPKVSFLLTGVIPSPLYMFWNLSVNRTSVTMFLTKILSVTWGVLFSTERGGGGIQKFVLVKLAFHLKISLFYCSMPVCSSDCMPESSLFYFLKAVCFMTECLKPWKLVWMFKLEFPKLEKPLKDYFRAVPRESFPRL